MCVCACVWVCLSSDQINRDLYKLPCIPPNVSRIVKFWFLEFGIVYYSRLAQAYSIRIVNRISKSHVVIRLEIICTSLLYRPGFIQSSSHHHLQFTTTNTQPKQSPPTPPPQLPPSHILYLLRRSIIVTSEFPQSKLQN